MKTPGPRNLPAAVVAEKLEAMVVLGQRNSRIKDFFAFLLPILDDVRRGTDELEAWPAGGPGGDSRS